MNRKIVIGSVLCSLVLDLFGLTILKAEAQRPFLSSDTYVTMYIYRPDGSAILCDVEPNTNRQGAVALLVFQQDIQVEPQMVCANWPTESAGLYFNNLSREHKNQVHQIVNRD